MTPRIRYTHGVSLKPNQLFDGWMEKSEISEFKDGKLSIISINILLLSISQKYGRVHSTLQPRLQRPSYEGEDGIINNGTLFSSSKTALNKLFQASSDKVNHEDV